LTLLNLTGSLLNPMPKNLPKTDSKENLREHLYVLILAGGGGTRLWPLSRENSPKQFIKLFDGKSLLQLTVGRAVELAPPDRIYVSTSAKYVSEIKKQCPRIKNENIIAEPQRKDTAIAHGLGAAYIYHQNPEAIIINLASDHLISPVSGFVKDILTAVEFADQNKFVTVGIKPKFPHTGMGHIKFKGHVGLKFVEKPPLDLAKKFTASGNYLWNANLYVWKAKLYLDLLKKHAPKTYSFFPRIINSIGTDKEKEIIQLAFQMAPSISVDYAVSEKVTNFVCITGHFNWSDVGDWNVVWQNLPQDAAGNAVAGSRGRGELVGLNSQNNLFILDKQLITLVGLSDMVVVDTPDAILICPKDNAQAVKQLHQILKEQKLLKYL